MLREEVWETESVQYHCPWVAFRCGHQVIIFKDGKHPAHFISIVTDVSRCDFSSNSYLKCEELHILIALRTSAFPLVYKPLWVTCPVWPGVAVGPTHWPDMHSSCVYCTSGLCRGVCEPPQHLFIAGVMAAVGLAHRTPLEELGKESLNMQPLRCIESLWLDLRYPPLHPLQWGTSAPVILHM